MWSSLATAVTVIVRACGAHASEAEVGCRNIKHITPALRGTRCPAWGYTKILHRTSSSTTQHGTLPSTRQAELALDARSRKTRARVCVPSRVLCATAVAPVAERRAPRAIQWAHKCALVGCAVAAVRSVCVSVALSLSLSLSLSFSLYLFLSFFLYVSLIYYMPCSVTTTAYQRLRPVERGFARLAHPCANLKSLPSCADTVAATQATALRC